MKQYRHLYERLYLPIKRIIMNKSYPNIILAVHRRVGNGTFYFFWIFRKCFTLTKCANTAFQNYSKRISPEILTNG